jgi:hypothetical protein
LLIASLGRAASYSIAKYAEAMKDNPEGLKEVKV